jgi:hypothetical protein
MLRKDSVGHRPWLMSVILATWETEIRRIMVQGQPEQKARPYLKKTPHQKELATWLKW